MTTVPPLSDKDREALRRTVRDLSDIAPENRARIDADFRRAERVAEEIRQGIRNPLR